jgi:thiol:disulfide interchange protein DsbD
VFATLGLGLALPYLVLCYSPGLLQRLPKSGAWMERFKQFLALPMLATVGWLMWVYGLQTSMEQQGRALLALGGLIVVTWAWGRHQRRGTAPSGKTWLVFTLLILSFASYAAWRSQAHRQTEESIWQPYSESAMQAALAQNKTVFVDFTAAWCVSCQVNKKAVLETETIKQALAASGIVLLRADWTKPDPAISAALHKLGRNGIPVYWIQRLNQPPVLLPEVLTADAVLSAIKP